MTKWSIGLFSVWHRVFKGTRFPLIHFLFLVVIYILFEIVWRNAQTAWRPGVLFFTISAFVCALASAFDMMAWLFKRLDEFVDVEKWFEFPAIRHAINNPPDCDKKAAEVEVSLLNNMPFELKYFAMHLGAKLSANVMLFITSFAFIFTGITRLSLNNYVYEEMGADASFWWSMFYSLDVITTLGGAAPLPQIQNTWIWIATGAEIFLLIVLSMIILTLATASVYEVFNLKTTYYSAFLRSILKDKTCDRSQ